MPLDRLVLILVIVLAAAGGTIWIAMLFFASSQISPLVAVLTALPVALGLYVVWRVISERLSNREDDHYDRIEK
jgi:hypothetical protein